MQNNQIKLKKNFIVEVLSLCLEDKSFLQICIQNLKFEYLPNKSEKLIYRYIVNYYTTNDSQPTIGIISQNLTQTEEILEILSGMKNVGNLSSKELLPTLELFIKKSKFVTLYDKVGELYGKGKFDESMSILSKEAEEIVQFEISEKSYSKVFEDFDTRQQVRFQNQNSSLLEKTTTGIRELDDMFHGGPNKGTSVLWMAPSGVGKSTVLRWVGISNARQGKIVVHFQLEGSEQECLDSYDSGWAGLPLVDIEFGNVSDDKRTELIKTVGNVRKTGGEIFVYAAETFDSLAIEECREILLEISKKYKVDVAIFDYAELLSTKGRYGNDESSERKRRGDIANKLTNLAVELNITVHTATQSTDIQKAKKNNDEFCITRNDISEFKGFLKPFSYFFTLNQTEDEYEEEIMRIYIDKVRKHKIRKRVIKIYQARGVSRFYDSHKTRLKFGK